MSIFQPKKSISARYEANKAFLQPFYGILNVSNQIESYICTISNDLVKSRLATPLSSYAQRLLSIAIALVYNQSHADTHKATLGNRTVFISPVELMTTGTCMEHLHQKYCRAFDELKQASFIINGNKVAILDKSVNHVFTVSRQGLLDIDISFDEFNHLNSQKCYGEYSNNYFLTFSSDFFHHLSGLRGSYTSVPLLDMLGVNNTTWRILPYFVRLYHTKHQTVSLPYTDFVRFVFLDDAKELSVTDANKYLRRIVKDINENTSYHLEVTTFFNQFNDIAQLKFLPENQDAILQVPAFNRLLLGLETILEQKLVKKLKNINRQLKVVDNNGIKMFDCMDLDKGQALHRQTQTILTKAQQELVTCHNDLSQYLNHYQTRMTQAINANRKANERLCQLFDVIQKINHAMSEKFNQFMAIYHKVCHNLKAMGRKFIDFVVKPLKLIKFNSPVFSYVSKPSAGGVPYQSLFGVVRRQSLVSKNTISKSIHKQHTTDTQRKSKTVKNKQNNKDFIFTENTFSIRQEFLATSLIKDWFDRGGMSFDETYIRNSLSSIDGWLAYYFILKEKEFHFPSNFPEPTIEYQTYCRERSVYINNDCHWHDGINPSFFKQTFNAKKVTDMPMNTTCDTKPLQPISQLMAYDVVCMQSIFEQMTATADENNAWCVQFFEYNAKNPEVASFMQGMLRFHLRDKKYQSAFSFFINSYQFNSQDGAVLQHALDSMASFDWSFVLTSSLDLPSFLMAKQLDGRAYLQWKQDKNLSHHVI